MVLLSLLQRQVDGNLTAALSVVSIGNHQLAAVHGDNLLTHRQTDAAAEEPL